MSRPEVIVVGGGIVGLATALAITDRETNVRVRVLEKEGSIAAHQTGHNSGVIHSGIYYEPGSLKARFAVAGSRSLIAFCTAHGVTYEVCGKVVVAVEPAEVPRLRALHARGRANGVDVRRIGVDELKEVEPHVHGIEAILVPTAGIVDFGEVAHVLARLHQERGGEIHTSTTVLAIRDTAAGVTVETDRGSYTAGRLVNCGGLHSDRIARAAGLRPNFRIVPFRGEYFELRPERRHLVRSLVYPVPNPAFPFLGVHFTRTIDGSVHAGPNAVLALAREGYRKTDFVLRDFVDATTFPGFWRLAARHAGEGAREMFRSLSRRAFLRTLRRLVPEVRLDDLVPTDAGVRAQALTTDGRLVDDFLVLEGERTIHVCNAPSPAATAALEIGAYIAERLCEHRPLGRA